jgi:Leucine-rich repeat (LRR) protein
MANNIIKVYIEAKQCTNEFEKLKKEILKNKENYFPQNNKITSQLQFIEKRQKLIVETIEAEVKKWWERLPEIWKDVFLFSYWFSKTHKEKKNIQLIGSPSETYYNPEDVEYYVKPVEYNCFEVVEQLRNNKSFFIQSEIIKSIETYNPLCYFDNIAILSLKYGKADLSPISKLKNLITLDLENNASDLTPIKNLKKLKNLYLDANKADLTPISNLQNLKMLQLRFNNLSLEPIALLKNLEELDLWDNKATLYPIANLTNLKNLSLNNSRSLDLIPLSKLTNLKSLTLSFSYSDIRPITKLTNLSFLELTGISMEKIGEINEYLDIMVKKGCEVIINNDKRL